MVDNLLVVFERATVRYLDQLSSSDEEIAIEYQNHVNKDRGNINDISDKSSEPDKYFEDFSKKAALDSSTEKTKIKLNKNSKKGNNKDKRSTSLKSPTKRKHKSQNKKKVSSEDTKTRTPNLDNSSCSSSSLEVLFEKNHEKGSKANSVLQKRTGIYYIKYSVKTFFLFSL